MCFEWVPNYFPNLNLLILRFLSHCQAIAIFNECAIAADVVGRGENQHFLFALV